VDRVAGRADARGRDRRDAVRGRRVAVDPFDAALTGEERLHVIGRAQAGLGDDGAGACLQEAGREVVHPLDRVRLRPLGQAGLAVATRVAEVAQHDDRVGRQVERLDRRLAEVLVAGVVDAGDRVEPEAVLGGRVERVAIPARPAVAVAEVDDDRGPGQRLLDGGPRRVRRVDLDDLGSRLARGAGGLVREALVVRRRPADGAHDDRDARNRSGREGRGRSAHRHEEGGEDGDEDRARGSVQRSVSCRRARGIGERNVA
jgi:hypothetical protein